VSGRHLLVRKTRFRGAFTGAIAVLRTAAWRDEDRRLAAAVEAQLGAVLAQIAGQRRLEHVSRTDPLTGLLNRRAFLGDLSVQLERATRQDMTGALFYLDLDNFKPVNDRLGHAQGDAVLRQVATLLRRGSRAYDLAARLGGDEFALWLDGIAMDAARRRARQLIADSAALKHLSASSDQPLGMSIGIAMFDPARVEPVDSLLARADGALYAAKRRGKGRSAIARPPRRDPRGSS
jgi:diguanylate cyclase (GGDEF)-like protein